ncbi:MAG: hypothetical protein WC785_01820 [Tatlockia sp.]|jgi:hypothetical protein
MENRDEALAISNPRLLAAIYFGVLSVVSTIIIDTVLYAIGMEQILPTFQAILLAVVVASSFGALFGKWIVHCKKPYRRKAFLLGFGMVVSAVPLYALLFLYLLHKHHPHAFVDFTLWHVFITYLFILFYCFIFVGLWLALAAGLAAMYLRGRLVYDIMHSKADKVKLPKEIHNNIDSEEPKAQNREHLSP